eukprot:gene12194-8392_t
MLPGIKAECESFARFVFHFPYLIVKQQQQQQQQKKKTKTKTKSKTNRQNELTVETFLRFVIMAFFLCLYCFLSKVFKVPNSGTIPNISFKDIEDLVIVQVDRSFHRFLLRNTTMGRTILKIQNGKIDSPEAISDPVDGRDQESEIVCDLTLAEYQASLNSSGNGQQADSFLRIIRGEPPEYLGWEEDTDTKNYGIHRNIKIEFGMGE